MDHSRRPPRWPAPSRSSAADARPSECCGASECWCEASPQHSVSWRDAACSNRSPLGPRTAPNRILFGPHVTNLGDDDRRFTRPPHRLLRAPGPGRLRHDRRRGGQRPRVRLAVRAGAAGRAWRPPGWAAIVAACRPHGALVIASLDHAGGQGSSAYSQRPLWAPSRVPEVATREVPKWMEAEDIAAVVDGFGAAAAVGRRRRAATASRSTPASTASCASSCPGLTNQRGDEWGTDRLRFARDVITAVRAAVGADRVVGLRLSCDELAPWAGITPEMAPAIAADLVARRRRLRRRRARGDLLDRADPARLPPADRLQRRPRRGGRRGRRRAGRPAGLGRRRRPGRVGASAATTTRPRARRSR